MTPVVHTQPPPILMDQLGWFIRLRWGAGAAVILAALANILYLHWYPHAAEILVTGLFILGYNAAFWLITPRRRMAEHPMLLRLGELQIVLDLLCLTLLTVWTGGPGSPLLGFYVFHMVFASLLLTRGIAYATAGGAALAVAVGLVMTGQFPPRREDLMLLAGWAVTLAATVYLTNHVTQNLHRHQRRIQRQRDRIREMAQRIHHQQQAMIQQEKVAAIGQLAAGVAHEISNPVACIDSMLQLLQRHGGNVQGQEIQNMREQIARISQIVQQLVHFAHPGDGERQVLPLNQVVQRALQIIRFDPRLRQVALEIKPGPEDLLVSVQPRAIQQVLVNLILNALDAMTQSPQPRLELCTRWDAARCRVEVIDNGHGIRKEHLPRMFQPFFTTKPVGKGTGLGLAISYNIVRSMNGDLEVESTPGQGTRFIVSLPVARTEPTL